MTARPKVSFVIPARNEERFIADAIASLRGQDIAGCSEILVVDNGSQDATSEIASAAGAEVVFEPQSGLSHARQAGYLASSGEFLIYIDADTRLPKGWTNGVIERFTADPGLVAISTAFSFHGGRRVDDVAGFIFRSLLAPAISALLRLGGRPEVVVGSAIAVRIEALHRANGVDQRFQFYGEDTMLARSLSTQGRVRFLCSPRYDTSARRYQQRGIARVVWRYFTIFALIHLGFLRLAARLANDWQERDRGERQSVSALTDDPDFVVEATLAGS